MLCKDLHLGHCIIVNLSHDTDYFADAVYREKSNTSFELNLSREKNCTTGLCISNKHQCNNISFGYSEKVFKHSFSDLIQ